MRSNTAESEKPAKENGPHITIRQRIIDILKSGQKLSTEVHLLLTRQGIPDSVNTTQHLYLLKRDDLVEQNEDGFYRLKD